MKNRIYISFFVLAVSSTMVRGQVTFPTNNETGEIEFVNIVQLDSTSKNTIFNRAKWCVVDVLKSSMEMVQYENIDDGIFIYKGSYDIKPTGEGMNGTVHQTQAGNVRFSLEIAAKDNKYRIRIYDVVHEAKSSGGKLNNAKPECGMNFMTVRTWNSIQKQTLDGLNMIIKVFETTMRSHGQLKDDW